MMDAPSANAKATMRRRFPHRPTDRDMPYRFGGRPAELELLEKRLAFIRESGDARGGMALVTGVPGAGKTTLAAEFANRCQRIKGVETITADVTCLENPVDLFVSIGRKIRKHDITDKFMQIADVHSRRTAGKVDAGLVAGQLDHDIVRQTSPFTRLLRKSAEKGLWKRKALVLVIDELQTIEAPQAPVLHGLHMGRHGCPIMVVGAGLQNTASVLSSHGISRLSNETVMELKPLRRNETIDVIDGSLAKFDIQPSEQVLERLAAATHDFPQHIHTYIGAVIDTADAAGGWRDRDVDKALIAGDESRAMYYKRRLEAMGNGHQKMLPVIDHMRRIGATSLYKWEAEDVISSTGRVNGTESVAAAIRHGVLTVNKGLVSFGIPSFHSHMHELHDRHRLAMRPPDRGGPTQ